MAHWREGSSALVVVLIAYRHDYKGLPGSIWPRTLSRQCLAGDLSNPPKVMVLHWYYKHFWLTPVGLFALVSIPVNDFAAAGSRENDCGMSTMSACLMF